MGNLSAASLLPGSLAHALIWLRLCSAAESKPSQLNYTCSGLVLKALSRMHRVHVQGLLVDLPAVMYDAQSGNEACEAGVYDADELDSKGPGATSPLAYSCHSEYNDLHDSWRAVSGNCNTDNRADSRDLLTKGSGSICVALA